MLAANPATPRQGLPWELEGRGRLEALLPAYIARQRWFRSKASALGRVQICDAIPLTDRAALTVLEATTDGRPAERYVLPLAVLQGALADGLERQSSPFVISRLPSGQLLCDALADAEALGALATAFDSDSAVEWRGVHAALRFERLGAQRTNARGLSPRPLGGEQSNSSIVYGDQLILKLFRRLDVGESTDLEVGRALTEIGFPHIPPLRGAISWVPTGEAPSTLGLLQAFLPNKGVAWERTLERLGRCLTVLKNPGDSAPALSAEVSRALLIGRRTAQLHVALARCKPPSFHPSPFEMADQIAAVERLTPSLEPLLRALRQRLPKHAIVDELFRRRDELQGHLSAFRREAMGGKRLRIHGDLHLGQILEVGDGLEDVVFIDFEGEPTRSLAERRAPRSPLVDVAGMLRSYHYAAVSAGRLAGGGTAAHTWLAHWHAAVARGYLRGYLAELGDTPLLPTGDHRRTALDFFLLEKCLYELGYELNNRPDWVEVPLAGLLSVLDACDGDGMSSALDFDAFHAGSDFHAHDKLGAHLDGEGTRFAVWAPDAEAVSLIGDFNGWKPEADPLQRLTDLGVWGGRRAGAVAGQRYKYRIRSRHDGILTEKADPFSLLLEVPPATASVIADLAYRWNDRSWMESRRPRQALDAAVSIYEVHLGSWRRVPAESDRFLTYRELAPLLCEYVSRLGFSHVELMPVMEHPFYGSWGYQITGYFAPTHRYGSPQDLMYLIDQLHQAGLGVILDWVPAHFPNDAHGLGFFDGSHLFEHADPRQGFQPDWNSLVFNYGRNEVRSFLSSSALFWADRYHADALRVDGVASMLYLDYSRKAGEWIPNRLGGRENLEAVDFLKQLNEGLHREQPDLQIYAEESTAWPLVTKPASLGGLGFGYKWDLGWTHDTLAYFELDPLYRSYHQSGLTFRSLYAFAEQFVLPLSHDEVVYGKRSLLEKMPGDEWQKLANLRLLFATLWAQPGKKLLFMGGEIGQRREWNHDASLDWDLLDDPRHRALSLCVGELNRLQRAEPALHELDGEAAGFEWIDGSNAAQSIVTYLRKGRSAADDLLVALNYTPVPHEQYRVGVPRAGSWQEIFNSDAKAFGGSGWGNLGGVEAAPLPWNGRRHSLNLTLPPLGAVFLKTTG